MRRQRRRYTQLVRAPARPLEHRRRFPEPKDADSEWITCALRDWTTFYDFNADCSQARDPVRIELRQVTVSDSKEIDGVINDFVGVTARCPKSQGATDANP